MLPHLSLILGGAASGKSAFAERLATAAAPERLYIATAAAPDPAADAEMAARIARHQARRGTGWHLAEAPRDLAPALARAAPGQVVLLDCATLWLANALETDPPADPGAALAAMLEQAPAPVIVVSNELGQGIVPENALARRFRQLHGEMNQTLAARAGLVVQVVAGLAQVLKGRLPEIPEDPAGAA